MAVRKTRHWRQALRGSKVLSQPGDNSRFILRRPMNISGMRYQAGDAVPDHIDVTKLRRWWHSRRIELAGFDNVSARDEVQTSAKALPKESVVDDEDETSILDDVEDQPAAQIVKEADRRWRIEGRPEIYKSKGAAEEALKS